MPQTPHKLLAIPGPIEVSDEVLEAIAQPPVSHVSPEFVNIFKECIQMTRDVLFTTTGQPFIVSGSGTLGWDQIAANLIEPEENVLVLHTGYFGDGFTDCLTTYGAKVDQIRSEVGGYADLRTIADILRQKRYKAVTTTHVDTSTGVLSDIKSIAEVVRTVSPETLVIVDGVCSVATEEIRMDAWDIDIVITASQKGLGAPPGLSIVVASQRAIKVFENRKGPITSYYASWKKWLPIMKAYGSGSPAYFATPAVNLVRAYHASLKQLTASSPSLQERFRIQRQVSARVRAIADQLGLRQLPKDSAHASNGMTAAYLPDDIKASEILPRLSAQGVVVAGGLLGDIKDKYIRIGHMGVTAANSARGDIDVIERTLKKSITELRAEKATKSSGSFVDGFSPAPASASASER
ncbi:hypothetical protein AX16_001419 [Volvariella volvacea WC 439]|nr:hypothetical protein AX16_001419 [Volvariella volvacea WC 439]